jgi:hypothetical protein
LHFLDVSLPFYLQLAVAFGDSLLDRERGMHPAQVLGEKILPIELVALTFGCALRA